MLGFLCGHDLAQCNERRVTVAGKIAHFAAVRELDRFDYIAHPSIDQRHLGEFAAYRWMAHG